MRPSIRARSGPPRVPRCRPRGSTAISARPIGAPGECSRRRSSRFTPELADLGEQPRELARAVVDHHDQRCVAFRSAPCLPGIRATPALPAASTSAMRARRARRRRVAERLEHRVEVVAVGRAARGGSRAAFAPRICTQSAGSLAGDAGHVAQALAGEGESRASGASTSRLASEQARHELRGVRDQRDGGVVLVGGQLAPASRRGRGRAPRARAACSAVLRPWRRDRPRAGRGRGRRARRSGRRAPDRPADASRRSARRSAPAASSSASGATFTLATSVTSGVGMRGQLGGDDLGDAGPAAPRRRSARARRRRRPCDPRRSRRRARRSTGEASARSTSTPRARSPSPMDVPSSPVPTTRTCPRGAGGHGQTSLTGAGRRVPAGARVEQPPPSSAAA